jgi:hypothetical protein
MGWDRLEAISTEGGVSKVDLQVSHQHPKLLAVDKEANNDAFMFRIRPQAVPCLYSVKINKKFQRIITVAHVQGVTATY